MIIGRNCLYVFIAILICTFQNPIFSNNTIEIQEILQNTQSILNTHEINYNQKKEIIKILEKISNNQDKWHQYPKLRILAQQLIVNLNLCKLDQNLKNQFNKITKKIYNQDKIKLHPNTMNEQYNIESAGVAIHGKIFHPYPYKKIQAFTKKWEQSGTHENFGAYLKKYGPHEVKESIQKHNVKYLNANERMRYDAHFHNEIIRVNGKCLKNGFYIFVLDLAGKHFYVGEKIKGKFQHSSFVRGAPIQCAGKLWIKNKKIKFIKLKSGHYRPTESQGRTLRAYLSDKNRLGKSAKRIKIISY